jgi:hypothetical protein
MHAGEASVGRRNGFLWYSCRLEEDFRLANDFLCVSVEDLSQI